MRFLSRRPSQPRIAIVRHSHYPYMHVERDVEALRFAGYHVDVICDHRAGQHRVEQLKGVTIFRLPIQHTRGTGLRYVYEYTAFPLLATLLLAVRAIYPGYDFVEIDTMPDWLVFSAIVPKLLGAKVTLYMFENMPELLALDGGLPASHPLVRALIRMERLCCAFADALIAPHEMARRLLVQQGIPTDKIKAVVLNVPDERMFLENLPPLSVESSIENRRHLKSPPAFRLVTHGSLLRRYGVETLIAAVAQLRHDIPNLQLDVIGEGEYRPHLQQMTRELGLGGHVTFAGSIPFKQVAARLVRAEVGVVPMWAPFVPNKLMEYLAIGLPVIATDWLALRLYFDDSILHYVEPRSVDALANGIVALYSDDQRRSDLATTGYHVFHERFSWSHTRDDYLSVYDLATTDGPSGQLPSPEAAVKA